MGVALPGCGLLLGLGDFSEGGANAGGGAPDGGTPSSSTGSSSSASGTGGAACSEGEMQTCYEFDAGTPGMGACASGKKTCKGGQFGMCEGQMGPMPEDCDTVGDEDCDGVACSDPIWSEDFGGAAFQIPESLAVDSDGSVLIAGLYTGTLNFGPTPATAFTATSAADIFLVKLGPDGSFQWSKSFGLPAGEADIPRKVAISSTGQIFLTGFYKVTIDFGGGPLMSSGNADFFVASFDKSGGYLWAKTFGLDSNAAPNDLAVGPDGDPVIGGYFDTGSIVFGGATYSSPMGSDGFVAKLAHGDGSAVWSHSYGDVMGYPVGDQIVRALAVDHNGNIVVAGTFTTEIDLKIGVSDFSPKGGSDVFVIQLSPKGDTTWHTYFYGPNDEAPSSVAVDSTGSPLVAGWFSGMTHFDGTDFGSSKSTSGPMDTDFFLVKLDSQGKHTWVKQLGDTSAQLDPNALTSSFSGAPFFVTVDPKDNVILAGGFLGTIQPGTKPLTSAGDADWFVAKLAPNATHLWSHRFGDIGSSQIVTGVGTDPKTSAVLLTGANDGMLAIGPGAPLSHAGSIDVAVAKLLP